MCQFLEIALTYLSLPTLVCDKIPPRPKQEFNFVISGQDSHSCNVLSCQQIAKYEPFIVWDDKAGSPRNLRLCQTGPDQARPDLITSQIGVGRLPACYSHHHHHHHHHPHLQVFTHRRWRMWLLWGVPWAGLAHFSHRSYSPLESPYEETRLLNGLRASYEHGYNDDDDAVKMEWVQSCERWKG